MVCFVLGTVLLIAGALILWASGYFGSGESIGWVFFFSGAILIAKVVAGVIRTVIR